MMQYKGLQMLFKPQGQTGSKSATMYKALMPRNEQNCLCKHIRHLILHILYIFS